MTYPVRIDRSVRVPMADGTEIALTLYLPDAPGDGPFPAVVESVPYRKDDDCYARDWVNYTYLAEQGFAGVRIDIRGTGASDGVIENEYVPREQEDTLEVLAWTAAQDWCSGRLGMWGISWGGFSALQTAMLRPPELKAIAAVHATHDRFTTDVHYYGGALHLLEQVDWPVGMVALNGLPPDPEILGEQTSGELWREKWRQRLESTPQWLPEWLAHQQRDAYWIHGSPAADYGSITAATLLFGGWLDGYVDGILDMLEHLECPRRAIVGPWGHYRPATGVPKPTYDHLAEMVRWFGHWLRGDDNGVRDDPRLTAYIRTAAPFDAAEATGYWRHEPHWPPEDQRTREWHLDARRLSHQPGSGSVESWSGPWGVGGQVPQWDTGGWGSADTGSDDLHSLTFETEPLSEALEILGKPVADLLVSVDRPFGHVAVRLIDVAPDGEGRLISRGLLNLSFREGFSRPSPVPVGEPIRARIELRVTSAVIQPGHRLRLAVAGADFPLAWPPPGAVTLSVHHGNQSKLVLPTVERMGPGPVPVEEAPTRDAPVENLGSGHESSLMHDDGVTTYRRMVSGTQRLPLRSDFVYENRQTIEVSVPDDDPLGARAWSKATVRLSRPGWEVSTEGTVTVTCDATRLRLDIELIARESGDVFWQKGWKRIIPREWI
jgi:putative CocE/NonD family hydrolase